MKSTEVAIDSTGLGQQCYKEEKGMWTGEDMRMTYRLPIRRRREGDL